MHFLIAPMERGGRVAGVDIAEEPWSLAWVVGGVL